LHECFSSSSGLLLLRRRGWGVGRYNILPEQLLVLLWNLLIKYFVLLAAHDKKQRGGLDVGATVGNCCLHVYTKTYNYSTSTYIRVV
jgi:hypothetical protein